MTGVDYWRRQGLSVEFLPYRVYEFAGEHYFEFFALPYDNHRNPAQAKGEVARLVQRVRHLRQRVGTVAPRGLRAVVAGPPLQQEQIPVQLAHGRPIP